MGKCRDSSRSSFLHAMWNICFGLVHIFVYLTFSCKDIYCWARRRVKQAIWICSHIWYGMTSVSWSDEMHLGRHTEPPLFCGLQTCSVWPIMFKPFQEDSWRRSQLLTRKSHFQQHWSAFRETWSKREILKYPLKHNFSFLSLLSTLKWISSWKAIHAKVVQLKLFLFHPALGAGTHFWESDSLPSL